RYAVGLDDEAARWTTLPDGETNIAHSTASLPPFLAHASELSHTAHIALAACGYAAMQPTLFTRDLAVELMALDFLLFEDFVAPGWQSAETLFHTPSDPTSEPSGGPGEVFQEAAVVADQNQSGA